MNRKLIFAGVVVAVAIAAPAKAQVTIEMSEITCKQFSEYDPETKYFISNWMRGYFSAKKNLSVVEFALCQAQHRENSALLQEDAEISPDGRHPEERPLTRMRSLAALWPGFVPRKQAQA